MLAPTEDQRHQPFCVKKMNYILLSILFFAQVSLGGESFFFVTEENGGEEISIKDDRLLMEIPIKKVSPPRSTSIAAFYQGYKNGRTYKIQVNLAQHPEKEWIPSFKLDDKVFMYGVTVSRVTESKFSSSFSIESDSKEEIWQWTKLLSQLLKIPAQKVDINLEKEELHTAEETR